MKTDIRCGITNITEKGHASAGPEGSSSAARCAADILILFLILAVVFLTGCGSSGQEQGGGAESSGGAKDAGGSGGSLSDGKAAEGKDSGEGAFQPHKFVDSLYDEKKAEGNDEVKVDLSHLDEGYVSLLCDSDKGVKFQVIHGEDTYTYDVSQREKQVFPLTAGEGKYSFRVMKNEEGKTYYELYRTEADVKLKDEFQPYIRPNQFADYSKKSDCVKTARRLAEESASESDFISRVYDFVCSEIAYDKELAKNVPSDYVPDPDEVLKTGKGICFSYASLAASMLRSQGVPTRIIFGYVSPDDLYHAWNMFYTEEQGWVTVDFETEMNEWNRLDLTFSAGGTANDFIKDNANYQDIYQY